MITGIDIANFCISAMGMTIAIMGLILASHADFMEKWLSKYFSVTFSLIIAYVLSSFTSQISLYVLGSEYGLLSQIAIFFESLFSSIIMPILTVCILHICGENTKSNFFFFNIGLWSIYFILLVITQFTTVIYYITPDNIYHRGPFYPILLIPPVLLMISNLVGVIKRKNVLSEKVFRSMIFVILISMISMLLQMISQGILLIVLGTSLATMYLFLYMINDQIEKNILQSKEIASQQLTIRTLQMRPHFIYNTLINIYYLCEQDPHKAQSAIDDFTKYLRKNFVAITSEDLVPFDDELEHAKAYLAVVKVRYEEMLFVEYNADYTSFRLPPLTLEPVVENAVKHGLNPDADSLFVSISSKKYGDTAIITVEDNGNGFSSSAIKKAGEDENDSHIGLSNVKSRLKEMCNGSLKIGSREGGGTIVTITVPL